MRGKNQSKLSINYWMNADKKTVEEFLAKNTDSDYELKKKKLICKIHKKLK